MRKSSARLKRPSTTFGPGEGTNIYVSALHFGGKPMQLLQMGLEGELDIALSQPILDETLRVLALGQFRGVSVLRVGDFLLRKGGRT